jgi:hypothetical protein
MLNLLLTDAALPNIITTSTCKSQPQDRSSRMVIVDYPSLFSLEAMWEQIKLDPKRRTGSKISKIK